MSFWTRILGLNRESLVISVRTALATMLSLVVARLLKMPESYWAPISTIVILLSTIDPLTLAWQRFAGTALGALLGAVIATLSIHRWAPSNWIVYGVGILLCGVVSSMLRLGSAYRFAAITLTIVLLIAHERSPWVVATHRFIEVSLGIAVALLVTVAWPIPAKTSWRL
ncbi:MAG TPA: FUSC family protein [Candidatus Sulfotelmatobacter sp.]|nr:FUSC family protein [Candidatus Sulfotelmatobacter sp.]